MGSFVIIVTFIGIVTLIGIALWIRQREQIQHEAGYDALFGNVASDSDDSPTAVLVTSAHGDLLHVNSRARQWMALNGNEPDLEDVIRLTQPADNLLGLLSGESESSFQLGQQWVDATSHSVPTASGMQTVVVMREKLHQAQQTDTGTPDADGAPATAGVMNVSRVMRIINDIGETVDASIGVEPALQMLLDILNKTMPLDAGEICVWDEEKQFLEQRGWIGDTRYLLTVAAAGGGYKPGKGLAGWVAEYRKPIVVTGVRDTVSTRDLMQDNPYRSGVSVPILFGEELVGTITLFHEQADTYDNRDIALLQAVSKPIGTSIRNATMYARQEDRIRDIASLQQIAEQPKGERGEAAPIYALLNERMANLMNADMCGVFLYDDAREALVPQLPFYGLPDHVANRIVLPLPPNTAQRDIWENQPYWVSNDVKDEPLAEAISLASSDAIEGVDSFNLKSLLDVAGINNTALFPMQVAGERFGVMAISNKRSEGGFLPNDIQNLRVLSSQATLVVENVRLYQRERRIDTELVGLQEMTHAIGALSHEGEFYLEISERIGRLMDSAMCGVLLYDQDRQALVSQLPFYGIDSDFIHDYHIEMPSGSIMEQLFQDELYLIINRAQTDTLVFEANLDSLAEQAGVQNTMFAVMSAGGRRIGVVQVSNKRDGQEYDDQDGRLLQIFATQAAAIVENARLYQEVQVRANQAESLRRVAELASGAFSEDDSYEVVLKEIADLMNCEIVYVTVVDEMTHSLVTHPRWTYGVELAEPISQDLNQPGYNLAPAISGQYFMSNDVPNEPNILEGYRDLAEQFGLQRSILVPLTVGDRILGELGASNKKTGDFTRDDVAALSTVAAQIASSVERQLLFEATGENLRRRMKELDAISRISNEQALTYDLDQVLVVIREEAKKAINADDTTILILQPMSEWRVIDVPEMDRRVGEIDAPAGITPIEMRAIERGADPIVIDDYTESDISAVPAVARSAAAVAIQYQDQIVGVIHMYNQQPYGFDERASGFLMTLATKASLAYQSDLRYREQQERGARLRQRVDQLNRIFELGQMLQTSTDTSVIFEAIAYSVQQSIGYDTVLMTLVDEEAGVLRRIAHAGMPLDAFAETQDRTLTRAQLDDILKDQYRQSETYFFPIQELETWYTPIINTLSAAYEDNRSIEAKGPKYWHDGDMLLVTIVGQGGDLLGVMSLDRPYDNLRPTRTTIEVLEIFAHQAASMLENTRLFQESQRSAEREGLLNEMLESIAGTFNLRELVMSLASGLLDLVTYERLTLVLNDEADEAGFTHWQVTLDASDDPIINTIQQQSLAGTALGLVYEARTARTFAADDAAVQEYDDLRRWHQEGERTTLLLPLAAGGETLGVLHIGSQQERAFSSQEIQQWLTRVSQLVASTIQNARLFNQTMNLQVLNRSVVESIQQGIIVLDNTRAIININDFMKRAYGWGDDATGQDLFAYQPDLAPILENELNAVLAGGEPIEHLNETTPRDDDEAIVRNFYMYPLRSRDVVRGAVLLVEDVTERTQLEQAIENRAKQLEALTEVSTRITASLERDEVIALAMDELSLIIPFDTLTIWRRNGSFMVLEGASGFDDEIAPDDTRLTINNHDAIAQMVDSQRVVTEIAAQVPDLNLPYSGAMRSWMTVPLVNQGHVVGMFILTREDEYAYDNRQEQNVAIAFASQVAIALANADLFEQTFERTNELGTLLEAASLTSLTRNIDEVFANVAELMFTALDMESCTILNWEGEDDLEVQFSSHRMGSDESIVTPGTVYNLNKYPARRTALQNREVMVIVAVDDEERLPPYPDELDEMRASSFGARMFVPLIVSDRSIGLIQLEQTSNQEDSISQQKVRLARALGSQVAVAIQNARLTEETTSRFEELFTINQLSRSISSTLSLDAMLPILQEQVASVTNAEEIYLALYDEEADVIRFPLAARGSERFNIPPRPLGDDEASYVIKRGHSLSLGSFNYSIDELRRSMGISNGEGDIRSYMGVPVKSSDKVLGVLAIRHYSKSRAFDINYDNILTTVASQLGAAIQNARLFEQVQEAASEMEKLVDVRTEELEEERDRLDTLYQITSELARTLDMEQLLERSLGMVSKAVGAQDGVIMLTDPATDTLFSKQSLNPNNLIYLEDEDVYTHPAVGLATWLIAYDDSNDHVAVVEDLEAQDYWGEEGRATGLRSAMAVMLENNEDPMGVMVLLSDRVGAFTESHIKLLVPAANQVAAAINSADLYQLIRDQAERMGKLLRAEQEEAQKNSAILESIADGVMLADANGEIVLFNTAAERILELPRDQVMGQPLDRLAGIYGTSAVRWTQLVTEWAETPQILEDTITERIEIGEKIISIQLSPVHIGNLFLGTVSVFRDITKDVEADRAKTKFIENVSHEFRTPLTPVKGYTDMLLMTVAESLDPMQLDWVKAIKSNVDRLAILVDDVLNISKLDSGSDALHMTMIDLNDVIRPEFTRIATTQKNIDKDMNTTVTVADDLPQIRGDRDKLRQIFANLIDNAFNYTPADGNITVKVYRLPDEPAVQVEITDSGVGIPEEFRDRVWRRFERYDTHAVELDIAGTGLGLSLARDLVALHHGDIWFESELGAGTTFFVRLPIEQPNFRTATMEMPQIDGPTLTRDK
jgi:PAS domain S-box-containing protein